MRTSRRFVLAPACSCETPPSVPRLADLGGPSPLDDADRQFAGTVEPVVDHLVRVARRIVASDDLAWEAVQEALVGLWQRDEPPPNPRAWLIRAVIHRSLHLRRTLLRRREHEARASKIRGELSDGDNPLRRLLAEEARTELRDAVAGLARNHRDVIALHMGEGLDYETIAARLNIPIGTVRSRLNRAREALRTAMSQTRGAAL